MTPLLERALDEARKLPDSEQDLIASLIFEVIEDEKLWDAQFAATTDEQWSRMLDKVRQDTEAGRVRPLRCRTKE